MSDHKVSRRGFLKRLGIGAGALGAGAVLPCPTPTPEPAPTPPEALNVMLDGTIQTMTRYSGRMMFSASRPLNMAVISGLSIPGDLFD